MFTLNPSLTLNIGQRKNEGKSEKPAPELVEKAIEPRRDQSLAAAAPATQAPVVMQIDGFQLLLICLAIALVLMAGTAFIHAVRA